MTQHPPRVTDEMRARLEEAHARIAEDDEVIDRVRREMRWLWARPRPTEWWPR